MLRFAPFVAACALAFLASTALAAERRIAYLLESAIYVAKLDGTGAKKVANGSDPEISPDGTRVAYTHNDEQGNRFIAVVDVASGQRKIFNAIPGKNAYGPNWLPDGSAMTFSIFEESIWHLGYVKADGTGYRILRRAPDTNTSIYGLAWLPDGSGFFAHDLESFYRFDAQGKQQQKWAVGSLIPKGSFSSGGAMSVSPDGRTLLVEVDMLEPNPGKDEPGPPSAIWSVDPAAGRAIRQSAKGIAYNASPRWISADEMLFQSSGGKDKKNGVMRAKLGSTERQLIVSKATYPSVSRENAATSTPVTASADKAPAAGTAVGIASAPTTQADFAAMRTEWNRISDGKEWKDVRLDMKKEKPTQRHYAMGWFEGRELKMIMHVLADSDQDQRFRFYYYYEGALASVFERRKGRYTEISEVASATETYNFVREKLVGWKRTSGDREGEVWVDPKDAGFADQGKMVFKDSLAVSGPLFKAIGAD